MIVKSALAGLVVSALGMGAAQATGVSVNVDFADAGLTNRIIQMIALLTILSLAPSILIMATSFVRVVVVLSLLRTALGTQQSPPNAVIVSLALFLTAFIMAPVFSQAYERGVAPMAAGEMEAAEAFSEAAQPFRTFMLAQTRDEDLKLFVDLSDTEPVADGAPMTREDIGLHIIAPAFLLSELRRAFEMGFLLFIPFLVIDLVVAAILMSMGMMMLPPVIISLPFKLIFFVLVDGWRLVAGGLVESFGPAGVPPI